MSGERLMKRMALGVAGVGIVFPASAVQTWGTNWLGQTCPRPGPCFHLEWLATGAVVSGAVLKVANRSFTWRFLQARVNKAMPGAAGTTLVARNGRARRTPQPDEKNVPRRGR